MAKPRLLHRINAVRRPLHVLVVEDNVDAGDASVCSCEFMATMCNSRGLGRLL